MARSRILITNDDGIDAPGIQALRLAVAKDNDVLVVAPMNEQSGAGCSLSLRSEMAAASREENGAAWGHAVDGTPADCVKFAMNQLADFKPDFVLSGINSGMNAGNSVFYSGTVAGAIEATLFGIPAMACSLALHTDYDAHRHYDDAAELVRRLMPWMLNQRHERRSFWNLNMPNLPLARIEGIRYAAQGTSFFVDDFSLARKENGMAYYRNVGTSLVACAASEDSDDRVLVRGAASLSLLRTNLTVRIPEAARHAVEDRWDDLLRGGSV